jgi:phosphoglucomutase
MVIKTIVTTDMIDSVAKANGVSCYNVLTGFKWIADLIREKEATENYVIGGEESFGLMIGNGVRDKDAVSAVAIMCEMAAVEKSKGRTLYDKLIDLYLQYGFYLEDLVSITKKGMNGVQEIADMMNGFRQSPPTELDGVKVVRLLDYEIQTDRDLIAGTSTGIDLPKSNVLQFLLEDGSRISARPSGTEPKIKFYFSVKTNLKSKADFDETSAMLRDKINRIISELKLKG